MRKIYCGTSGSREIPETHKLSAIPIREEVATALQAYYGRDIALRPAQDEAIYKYGLLSDEKNVIISTPTNSGKTLLSYLLLLEKATEGKTTVLVEPLRALAYEKSEELKQIAELLKEQSKIKVGITVTTGDYRLTDEFMHSAPSSEDSDSRGQIIIATPERLDALSRVADNMEWFKRIELICFDEAHLLGDMTRGAALELLIAYLRSLHSNIRIVLMSATISNSDELAAWLDPCMVISDVPRYPQLDKWVYCVDEDEDINQVIISEISSILEDPTTNVLIFVYQTMSAEKLAQTIAVALSGKRIKQHNLAETMKEGVAWFHSNLSAATRESIIHAVESGQVRVTVSTTALAMGINLPATHVFVKDITFIGHKGLDVADLMQMIGRAGRGDKNGIGVVFLSKQNLSNERTIVDGITNETVPKVISRLVPIVREDYYGTPKEDMFFIDRVGNQVMGILNRFGTITLNKLKEYLGYTLGGNSFEDLPKILHYLSDWKLAYFNEDTNEYQLTHLGKLSSKCYLPPVTAANIGSLMRDLLEEKPDGTHISKLAPIDFLIILTLVSNENKPLARYSKAMVSKVAGYMESLPLEEKSYLYRSWIKTEPELLLVSACVTNDKPDADKYVYQCVYTAMLIYELSKGASRSQLERSFAVDVEERQEKLRDSAIWILCGFEEILEVKSFYYHLKNKCHAEAEDVEKVDAAFRRASKLIFALVANLKFRSNLGELVRSIKRVFSHEDSYPGEGTLKKLGAARIYSIKDLVGKTVKDLTDIGVKQQYAKLIVEYMRRRMS